MKKLVIIDAGHGGINDKGVYLTAPSKMWRHPNENLHNKEFFYEGVFNRQLVNIIIPMVQNFGYDISKVYDEVQDISLSERVRRANIIGNGRTCLFLSVHGNAHTTSSPRGFSVHVGTNASENSKKLAQSIAQNLQSVKETIFRRENMANLYWTNNFTVITRTRMPAVLTENGFFTNLFDARLMCNNDFLHKVAKAHAEGIRNYFEGL